MNKRGLGSKLPVSSRSPPTSPTTAKRQAGRLSGAHDEQTLARSRMEGANALVDLPENIADIVQDGDAVLRLKGISAAPDKP